MKKKNLARALREDFQWFVYVGAVRVAHFDTKSLAQRLARRLNEQFELWRTL